MNRSGMQFTTTPFICAPHRQQSSTHPDFGFVQLDQNHVAISLHSRHLSPVFRVPHDSMGEAVLRVKGPCALSSRFRVQLAVIAIVKNTESNAR